MECKNIIQSITDLFSVIIEDKWANFKEKMIKIQYSKARGLKIKLANNDITVKQTQVGQIRKYVFEVNFTYLAYLYLPNSIAIRSLWVFFL